MSTNFGAAAANGLGSGKAAPLPYVVDARASRFTVQALAGGVLFAMAHHPRNGKRTFFGDAQFRASGKFPLRQSDYGIKPISVAGGALRAKDKLKFNFEMVARTQE